MKQIACLAVVLSLAIPLWTTQAQDDERLIGRWEECPTPENLPPSIPLGLNMGLTGATSLYGIPQNQGAHLAISEVNQSGYLGRSKIEPIVEDGGATPETAIAAMEKLINEDEVVAVIGPTFSTQAFAADPIAQEAGIPVMGITNLANGITDMGNYIFRNGLLDTIQIPAAVDAVIQYLNIETAAIMYSDNDEFTVTGYEVFAETLEDRGIEITAEETFSTGDVDFSAQVTNILATQPDAIMLSALGAEAIPLLDQIRGQGYAGPIIGGNGFNAPAILREGGENAEGVIIGAAWHISNPNPINAAFVDKFVEEFGNEPDQGAAQAYTAVWIYATIFRCADSADPQDIRAGLDALEDFQTPLGIFDFDENRDPVHAPTVQIILEGQFQVLTEENILHFYQPN